MKKILVVLFAVMLVSMSASAFAAQKMGKGAKEVSAYASISSTDSSSNNSFYSYSEKSKDQTIALSLSYFLTDPISLGVRIDEMMTKGSGFKMSTTFIEVEGKFHFYRKNQPVIPYAGLSLGAAMTDINGDSSTGALFQPKAGVKVFLTENVAANAELNYSIYESSVGPIDVTNKTLKFQVGLSMFF
jgi:opacity protein-like surface antigen